MDSYSENTLMMKVKEGDLDKLGLLFERYHRRLFHYFYRLTGRRDVSEDLVQGVFERILKYRHTYSDSQGYAFSTWIYRIARNLHADHRRERDRDVILDRDKPFEGVDGNGLSRAVPPAGLHGEVMEDGPIAYDAENDAYGEDRHLKWLEEAIGRLDSEKKETLILSRYQGFKYREIAEIMDCSESAVKVRIYRAMKELKNQMNERRNKEEL